MNNVYYLNIPNNKEQYMSAKWDLAISKSEKKQSGYLLVVTPIDENSDSLTGISAWTTLSAAKREGAAAINRSRLKWEEQHLTDQNGETVILWSVTV